jgi:hypothetical protein
MQVILERNSIHDAGNTKMNDRIKTYNSYMCWIVSAQYPNKITNESLNAARVENQKMSEELRTHWATWTSLSDLKQRRD